MWQHKIISMLRKPKNNEFENIINLIKNAQCFYLGQAERYEQKNNIGRSLEDWYLPFNNMLFEFIIPLRVNQYNIEQDHKMAAHIFTGENGAEKYIRLGGFDPNNCFSVSFFSFFGKNKNCFSYPISTIVEKKSGKFFVLKNRFINNEYMVINNEYMDRMQKNDICGFVNCILSVLYHMIVFLNCSNVYTENVEPSRSLNKSRIKKNKEPFYQYKILKIKKGVPKIKYTKINHRWGEHISDCITAEHLCRGHFKEYTENAPLFGKYIGRFWWGPQIRGCKENGTIEKEYVVTV